MPCLCTNKFKWWILWQLWRSPIILSLKSLNELQKGFSHTTLGHFTIICTIKQSIKQDCLLQGQAQLDQRVVFCFCTLRLRGGVYVYKNEDHSLKMHFKSFQAILDNVVFYPFTSPLSCQRGGGSRHLKKMNHGLKMHFMSF